MCGTCGCGEPGPTGHSGGDAAHAHGHADGHPHPHGHADGHPHPHAHARDADHAARHARESRRVAVERSILEENRAQAAALAASWAARGIDAIALLGGPGAGKTTLLEATFRAAGAAGAAEQAVVEGDCATDLDAERVRATGASAVQVATGTLCHLDAHLVGHAAEALPLERVRRLWIENVGNLVCPAPFPCGEHRRVALVSVTEGDDKPEKYPALFASADLLLITKSDLLPHVDFDVARCQAGAERVRPGLPSLVISARSGAGLPAWHAWVRGEAA